MGDEYGVTHIEIVRGTFRWTAEEDLGDINFIRVKEFRDGLCVHAHAVPAGTLPTAIGEVLRRLKFAQ